MSDAANQWTKFYTTNSEIMYPAEAVIRIFKGSYPHLKMPKPKPGDSILDVGCGDGRHFPLFQSLGMKMAGSEIAQPIIDTISSRLSELNVDLRVGNCFGLPWNHSTFDYLLAWNCCYYMNDAGAFEHHVGELALVLKPGGWLICSIPKASCFIYHDCKPLAHDDRYVTILDEHFGLRNGEVMRRFMNRDEIVAEFSPHFTNFCHASIDIDMFGLAYNWHVFVAERRP